MLWRMMVAIDPQDFMLEEVVVNVVWIGVVLRMCVAPPWMRLISSQVGKVPVKGDYARHYQLGRGGFKAVAKRSL